jgi:hypothetical protein
LPIIEKLKPGVAIYRREDYGKGTLTCFARKIGTDHELYGVTAAHVLPKTSNGALMILSDQITTNIAENGIRNRKQSDPYCES